MKCERCNINYPDRFVQPIIGAEGTRYLDPKCAQKEIAEIHGLKEYHFRGVMALQILHEFEQYREGSKRALSSHN